MAQIFVSYCSADRPYARTLAAALENHGWTVWWDRELSTGATFNETILKELEAASWVIVLWSPNVATSTYVQNEAREAIRHGKMFPVLLPGSDRECVPLEFRHQTTLDLSNWYGSPHEETFQKIVKDLTAVLPPPQIDGPGEPPPSEVSLIVNLLKTERNVNIFVGQGALNLLPSAFDITCDLLRLAKLMPPSSPAGNAPAAPAGNQVAENRTSWILSTIETAASFAQIEARAPSILQTTVRELIKRTKNPAPMEFDTLCRILKSLERRRSANEGQRRHPFLIVTTRIDSLLERAFIRNGISFTRMVPVYGGSGRDETLDVDEYYCEGSELGHRKYRKGAGAQPVTRIAPTNLSAIDALLETDEGRDRIQSKKNINELLQGNKPQPFLYKLSGSLDIDDSYVLSRDHEAFCIARNEKNVIPDIVSQSLKNSPCLLLGYCQIDPDFHVLNHTLLPMCSKRASSIAITSLPTGRSQDSYIESRLWKSMRDGLASVTGGMNVIEIDVKTALTKISDELQGF